MSKDLNSEERRINDEIKQKVSDLFPQFEAGRLEIWKMFRDHQKSLAKAAALRKKLVSRWCCLSPRSSLEARFWADGARDAAATRKFPFCDRIDASVAPHIITTRAAK